MNRDSKNTVSGNCFCGAIEFSIELPAKFVAHCHCTMCRRAHGAAFVTWAGVMRDQFTLLAGEEQLGRYHSSTHATRSFCRACGSTLFFEESERWPGEIHIATVYFKEELDKPPGGHFYFNEHVSWLEVNDGLPRFGGPSGGEPLD